MAESHERQFTGWWIPVRLIEMFEAGILTLKEIILLCEIDSLSKKEKGCFASNQHFVDKLRLSETNVSKAISKLIQLELVFVVKFDGRKRYLKTYMDEIPDTSKTARQTCQKQQSRLVKNSKIIVPGNNKDLLSEVGTSDLSTAQTLDLPAKTEPTEFDYKAADQLYKVVSSAVKVNKRMDRKKWANVIRIMRTRDKLSKQDIGEMIKWYANHIGGEYDVEAFSAQSFRDKWEKLVAARARGDSRGPRVLKGGTPGHERKKKLRYKVLDWLKENGQEDAAYNGTSPYWVKRALVALGEKPDAISCTFVNSGGQEE